MCHYKTEYIIIYNEHWSDFIIKKMYTKVDHNKITDNLRPMISNIFDLYSWRIVIILLPLSFYSFIFLLFNSKSTINVIIQYSLLLSIYYSEVCTRYRGVSVLVRLFFIQFFFTLLDFGFIGRPVFQLLKIIVGGCDMNIFIAIDCRQL